MEETIEDVMETTELIENDVERSRRSLFSLNGITEEEVDAWRQRYGTIGWLTFAIPGINHAVVFVYRSLGRKEWKDIMRPKLQQLNDEDAGREIFCSHMLLYPPEAKHLEYWDNAPAFLPDTIEQVIMEASGIQPLTVPSRL